MRRQMGWPDSEEMITGRPPHSLHSYCKAKDLIKISANDNGVINTNPQRRRRITPYSTQLNTILWLRTGNNRHHQNRIGLSHTPECPCGTGFQNSEHMLQSCPLHREVLNKAWLRRRTIEEKLWGPKPHLQMKHAYPSHCLPMHGNVFMFV